MSDPNPIDPKQLETIVGEIIRQLVAEGGMHLEPKPVAPLVVPPAPVPVQTLTQMPALKSSGRELNIDLPDATTPEMRSLAGIDHPADVDGLNALIASTTSRIGVGRAGPRFRTRAQLLFQADAAITQDALWRDVDEKLLEELGLFSVQTRITGGKEEYLLRPDLGRQLSDDAKRTIQEKCVKSPSVQVCVGDGLSATAIEANLRKILPVIQQGCQANGLSMGTPFFIKYCRVGVMNDIGDLLKPDVLMLLIGERPGLGRADSMSVYMGYRPQSGYSDAERDVICNVFDGGGTNPLEAGAYAVQMAQKMLKHQSSGVKLKLKEGA